MGAIPDDWLMTFAKRATLVKKSPVSAAGLVDLERFLSPPSPRSQEEEGWVVAVLSDVFTQLRCCAVPSQRTMIRIGARGMRGWRGAGRVGAGVGREGRVVSLEVVVRATMVIVRAGLNRVRSMMGILALGVSGVCGGWV